MTNSIIHLAQTCEHCGRVFYPSKHGPTPRYCSTKHKQAAYRRRQLMKRFEEASAWLRSELATRNTATGPEVAKSTTQPPATQEQQQGGTDAKWTPA